MFCSVSHTVIDPTEKTFCLSSLTASHPRGLCRFNRVWRNLRWVKPFENKTRGGGGGTHIIFGWGCAARPDSRNVYPISDPVMCGKFGNSSWRLKRCSCFLRDQHGSTRYSKNGIPDQIDRIYTLFQTKMAKSIPYFRLEMLENDTLWGGTYLYGPDMGVPPPPPGNKMRQWM